MPTPDDRIDSLDILRGLAILGIVFMNLPGAATYFVAFFDHPPSAGWTPADQAAWRFMEIALEGTQRGLLQLLFGAGMLILAAKAMHDDAPVAIADRYLRRNLWLMVFGLANIFVLLFPGDILFIYALAALFLFPFRKLSPGVLLALGLAFMVVDTGRGLADYAARSELQAQVHAANARQASGAALTEADTVALKAWAELEAAMRPDEGFMAYDRSMRLAPFADYARYSQGIWLEKRAYSGEVFFKAVPEAFCVMLVGAALFKWRVIQGGRGRRFYLGMMLAGYAVGGPLRAIEVMQHLRFSPEPKIVDFTEEIARLAMTLGHLGLVHLLLATRAGAWLLAPFKAAGRTAFSLYVMQTLVTGWLLFPGIGLGLFGQFGWAGMFGISLAIIAVQLVLANLWLRRFRMGPVEWLWRSLVEWRRLPFVAQP